MAKKVVVFKILFKNNTIGWYRIIEDEKDSEFTEEKKAELTLEAVKEQKLNRSTGILTMIDCTNDKKTIIDMSEIVTIGYSLEEFSEK